MKGFKLKYIVICLFAFSVLESDLFAGSLQKLGGGSLNLPQDVTTENFETKKYNKVRVRIPLQVTLYKKTVITNTNGKTKVKYIPTGTVTKTLRAKINRINHFVLDGMHVETQPLKWDRSVMSYKTKINFSKRYGAYGQIEENIGSVIVAGNLEGENGLYLLDGYSSHRFKNKTGYPVLDVVAGLRRRQPISKNLMKKGGKKKF